jgi:hypothetical protein
MTSHIRGSSVELWRIIENGFKAVDPNNLTRREVIDSQFTATSLHMIQISMGSKDFPHIQHFYTAKEALEGLSDMFVGNPSMKRTRYDALSN